MEGAGAGVDPSLAERTIVAVRSDRGVVIGVQAIFTIVAETGGLPGLVGRLLKPRAVSLLFEPGYRLFAGNRGRFARFFRD